MKFRAVLHFSPLEMEIFTLLGRGLSPREIALRPRRKRSVKTTYTHVKRIVEKIGVPLSVQALSVFAAEYRLSGLRRENIIPERARYQFA